ncbi:MAG: hypothetical protein FWC86_06375 [Coriobacteriia bacterium]|nr:hypothetical protein [Coriobacteriia bacterium]
MMEQQRDAMRTDLINRQVASEEISPIKPIKPTTASIVRANNGRALWIHFALTLVGWFSVLILDTLLDRITLPFDTYATMLLVPIVGGALIYVLCGYLFLRPSSEKPISSVMWLGKTTAIVGVLAVIAFVIVLVVQDPSGFWVNPIESSALLLTIPHLFLNSLGYGILAISGAFDPRISITVIPLTCAVAIIPPGSLWIGLQLKTWIHKCKTDS